MSTIQLKAHELAGPIMAEFKRNGQANPLLGSIMIREKLGTGRVVEGFMIVGNTYARHYWLEFDNCERYDIVAQYMLDPTGPTPRLITDCEFADGIRARYLLHTPSATNLIRSDLLTEHDCKLTIQLERMYALML
jgi:hypothetical protein